MIIVTSLIEPSEIVIQQLDKGSTLYDEDTREPIKQVRRSSPITLSAQVSWTRSQKTAYKFTGQGGPQNERQGYLVFLRRELVAAVVTLQRGDKILSMAGRPRIAYLINEQFAGHHSNDPNLEFWDFVDKEPSSNG